MVILFAFLAGALLSGVGVLAYRHFIKIKPDNTVMYFPGSRSSQGPFSPEEIGTLIIEFYQAWLKEVDWKNAPTLLPALNNLSISWYEKMLKDLKGEMVTAETTSPSHIKIWRGVKISGQYKITRTALVYQLIHIALWNLHGDPFFGKKDEESYSDWMKRYDPVIKSVIEHTRRRGF